MAITSARTWARNGSNSQLPVGHRVPQLARVAFEECPTGLSELGVKPPPAATRARASAAARRRAAGGHRTATLDLPAQGDPGGAKRAGEAEPAGHGHTSTSFAWVSRSFRAHQPCPPLAQRRGAVTPRPPTHTLTHYANGHTHSSQFGCKSS